MYLALIGAFTYWLWGSCVFYSFWQTMEKPLMVGFFMGILTGRMEECIMMGAMIQAIYLGVIAPGGVMAADSSMAACIAIPIVLATGMEPAAALALAVPCGLLGSALQPLRFMMQGVWPRRAEKNIEDLNTGEIVRNAAIYPLAVHFLFRFVPVFIAIYFGSGAIEYILAVIPEWVTHGLSVAGGCLPAVGFAIALSAINNSSNKLLPFFVLGFFVSKLLGVSTISSAIFATCIALIILFFQNDRERELGM